MSSVGTVKSVIFTRNMHEGLTTFEEHLNKPEFTTVSVKLKLLHFRFLE